MMKHAHTRHRSIIAVAQFACIVLHSVLLMNVGVSHAAERILRFATEATYPPFVFMTPDGTIDGFEAALVRALCEEAKLKCVLDHRPFDSLLPSLLFKKIDAVFGGIGITEERKQQLLFSHPLTVNTVALIFPKDRPVSTHLPTLQHTILAVQQGTTFEHYLRTHATHLTVKAYASVQDAFLDLQAGRVAAVFGDTPVLKNWLKTAPASQYLLQELEKADCTAFAEGNGIAMRKEETEIMAILNHALEQITQKGIFQALQQKYLE